MKEKETRALFWVKRGTVSRKIVHLVWIAVLPIAATAIFAILSIGSFYREYDSSVRNITQINEFNVSFEENVNHSLYYLIIGGYDWQEIKDTEHYRNPYYQMELLRACAQDLIGKTENISAIADLETILRLLDSLEPRVDETIGHIDDGTDLQQQLKMLSDNVRRLTGRIQAAIERYVALGVSDMSLMQERISDSIRFYMLLFAGLVAMLMILVMLLSIRVSRSITRPIRTMCQTTQQLAAGDFSVRLPVEAGDETDMLAESFNRMAEELSELVDDIRMEQRNARDMELRLLQEQINPHFLYNTLDAIVWLIESRQNTAAEKMVSSLPAFFRTTLSKGRDWITVSEEKEHIRSYLEIQQIRYADIMQYSIDIPDEIADYYLMKLMLQPLVENALYHGIKKKRGGGRISVTGCESEDALVFSVEDNGCGMTEEELVRMRRMIAGEISDDSRHGFGIGNVAQRIRMYCGESYGITVESTRGTGSKVSICIPKLLRPVGAVPPPAFTAEETEKKDI